MHFLLIYLGIISVQMEVQLKSPVKLDCFGIKLSLPVIGLQMFSVPPGRLQLLLPQLRGL